MHNNYKIRKLFLMIALFIFVLVALGMESTYAADIYVTPDTSASRGNGSASSPYNSIETALSAALAGDIVRLLPGIYYTRVEFPRGGSVGNPITLMAHNGPRTAVIDCRNSGNVNGVTIDQSNIVVDGLEVRNVSFNGIKVDGDANGSQGPGSYGNYGMYYSRNLHVNGSDNIVIQNCYIHHIGYDGLKIGHANNIKIINNEVFRTGTGGQQQGIDMVGVYNSVIGGNYIHDDGNPSSMDIGIFCKGGSENIVIENNLVENILSPSAGVEVGGDTEWYNTRYTPSNFDFDINRAMLQTSQTNTSNFIDNVSSYRPEYMAEARNVIVRGNIIVRCDPPISFRNAYSTQVYNNTVVDSGWSQGWIKLWTDGNHYHTNLNTKFYNNLLVNKAIALRSSGAFYDKNVGTIYPLNTVGMVASNNIFWSMGAAPPLGNSAINRESQLFVDPQLDSNYQSPSTSPSFDAGVDLMAIGVLVSPYYNRFKVLVPQNGSFDIGANEISVVGGDPVYFPPVKNLRVVER